MNAGREAVERALKVATRAQWVEAPFGLDEAEAAIWHRATAAAYQHALEMMEPLPADLLAVVREMEDRKVGHSGRTSDTLWAWAARIRKAIGEPRR